ncbi:hypothetical protein [Micromonospora sp. NPDC049274]|uniref:hypothetical protein n=1 Tax=Micromonospora sp. NPDC049274 TaxID=3154829 RepID=UPI00341420B0
MLGVEANRSEGAALQAALVQALHRAAEPMVRLEDSTATRLHLSIRQTRVLRYRLANLLEMTGTGH